MINVCFLLKKIYFLQLNDLLFSFNLAAALSNPDVFKFESKLKILAVRQLIFFFLTKNCFD